MPKDDKKREPDPILDDDPTVEIAGVTYTLRRLGLRDVFRVARIFGRGVAVLGDQGNRVSPGQAVQVIVASMAQNETEVLTLMADVIGVKPDDLSDPERFPMEAIVDVARALAEHQDMVAFFRKLSGMIEAVPEMQTASGASSSS
jgi:hypothetical protein